MKISELCYKLQKISETKGDLEIEVAVKSETDFGTVTDLEVIDTVILYVE
jgi:hypothetical protein